MKKTNEKAITLIALIITIIVLLILAGVSISILTGENGLLNRAKTTKIKNTLSTAEEEVKLAINTLITEYYEDNSKITPKMIADEINRFNKRDTYAENETQFPTDIIYPANKMGIDEEIKITINNNLEVTEVKTSSGITNDTSGDIDNNDSESSNIGGQITTVGNVEVTITNIKARSFTINVNPENPDNIAAYQYYVNEQLVYEGAETKYVVDGLEMKTNYSVKVKAIPRNSIEVANVQTTTLEAPIIEISSKFNKYIYIDSTNGNDTTGNGTKENPYATLNKITESGIIETGYSYGIILNSGEYELTNNVFTLNCNKSINIIGKREKTTLNVGKIFTASSLGGNTNYTVNFYRLKWKDISDTRTNVIALYTSIGIYNVWFDIKNESNSYGYFTTGGQVVIKNAILPTTPTNFFRKYSGTIQLTNCYGGFTSGSSTTQSDWDYQTNYITDVPQVDSTTYRITDNESVWKNVGTEKNPDETQADLGVYGGEYSWECKTDLD